MADVGGRKSAVAVVAMNHQTAADARDGAGEIEVAVVVEIAPGAALRPWIWKRGMHKAVAAPIDKDEAGGIGGVGHEQIEVAIVVKVAPSASRRLGGGREGRIGDPAKGLRLGQGIVEQEQG